MGTFVVALGITLTMACYDAAMHTRYGQPFNYALGRRRGSLGEVVFYDYSGHDSDQMTAKQFRSLCAKLGYDADEAEVNAAFVRLDYDGSGFIEVREFLLWWNTEGFANCDRATELKYQSAEEQKQVTQAHTSFLTSTGGLDFMTREQFQLECYREGYAMSEWELDEAMRHLDKDESGTVEFGEYLRWRRKDDRFALLQFNDKISVFIHEVSKFFQENDTELKGTLTLEQFKPWFGGLYERLIEAGYVTYDEWDDRIKEVDKNGDGIISLNEFLKWYSDFWYSDGVLAAFEDSDAED